MNSRKGIIKLLVFLSLFLFLSPLQPAASENVTEVSFSYVTENVTDISAGLISGAFEKLFQFLGDVFGKVVDFFVSIFTNLFNFLAEIFTNLFNFLGEIFGKLFSLIWEAIKWIGDLLAKLFQGLIDIIVGFFKVIFELIEGVLYLLYMIGVLAVKLFLVLFEAAKVLWSLISGFVNTLSSLQYTPQTGGGNGYSATIGKLFTSLQVLQIEPIAYIMLFCLWFITAIGAIKLISSIRVGGS